MQFLPKLLHIHYLSDILHAKKHIYNLQMNKNWLSCFENHLVNMKEMLIIYLVIFYFVYKEDFPSLRMIYENYINLVILYNYVNFKHTTSWIKIKNAWQCTIMNLGLNQLKNKLVRIYKFKLLQSVFWMTIYHEYS